MYEVADVAVVLFNRSEKAQKITAKFEDIGIETSRLDRGIITKNSNRHHRHKNATIGEDDSTVSDAAETVGSKLITTSFSASVRDLWAHQDLGIRRDEVSAIVPSHDVVALRLSNVQSFSNAIN